MANDWSLYPVVAGGLAVLQWEARLEHAARRQGKLLFRFGLFFRLGLLGASAAVAYFGYRDWSGEVWWINLLAVLVTLSLLLAWPPTVVISHEGIERRWWWRPRTFIPWEEVVEAERNADGDMTIIGQHASIPCSRFQVDADRFQHEVLSRSRLKKFSRPEQTVNLHL